MEFLFLLIVVLYNFNIGSLIFISNFGLDAPECGNERTIPCHTIEYAMHLYSSITANNNKELNLFLLEGIYKESIFFICIPQLTVESINIFGEENKVSVLLGNIYMEYCNLTLKNIWIKSDTIEKINHIFANSELINFDNVTYDNLNMSIKFTESHVNMHNIVLNKCFYSNPNSQLFYIASHYKEINVNLDGLIVEDSYPFYLGIYVDKGNISLQNIKEEKTYSKKDVPANGNTRIEIKAGEKFPIDVKIQRMFINFTSSINAVLRLSQCRGIINDLKFVIYENIRAKYLINIENSFMSVENVIADIYLTPLMINSPIIQIDGESTINLKFIFLPFISYMCSQGHYLEDGICYPCDKGYYRNESNNQSKCLKCNYGFYSSNFGGVECTPCSAGTYCNTLGCITCRRCESDYVSSIVGSSKCQIFHPFLITSICLSALLMLVPMIVLILKLLKPIIEKRMPIFTFLKND